MAAAGGCSWRRQPEAAARGRGWKQQVEAAAGGGSWRQQLEAAAGSSTQLEADMSEARGTLTEGLGFRV